MALDALVLGPFVFTDFAVPDALPGGGRQQMRLHKYPGGNRRADTMGPDDNDRQFTVIHVGATAQAEVETLDQMRISGQLWPYSNGMEARLVVISGFEWWVERFNVIHSTICLTPMDNPSSPSVAPSSLDALVGADLGNAGDTVAANAAGQTPLTTPAGSAGIGSA